MLPKTAEYALRTVVWLAREPEQPLSADYLAKRTLVPRRYLHKVLQGLARSGLVQSQPGPGGGYSLAGEPTELTILDVVSAVAPIERIHSCPLGIPSHTTLCPLHSELDKVYAEIERALNAVTIARLLCSSNAKSPLCAVAGRDAA